MRSPSTTSGDSPHLRRRWCSSKKPSCRSTHTVQSSVRCAWAPSVFSATERSLCVLASRHSLLRIIARDLTVMLAIARALFQWVTSRWRHVRAEDSFSQHLCACCAIPSYFQLAQVCISCSIFYTKRICAECAPRLVEQVADFSWGSYSPDVFTLVSRSLIESAVFLFSGRAAFRAHGCRQTARSEGCCLTPFYTHVRHHRLFTSARAAAGKR